MDLVRIRYMKDWISQLPKGNITYKTIRGKKYAYLQWTENGKQRSRRVQDNELQELSQKIETRKALERKLKEAPEAKVMPDVMLDEYYFAEIKYGQELLDFVEPIRNYKKRECFSKLQEYVYGNSTDRVLILYGLRRTGKTTLIRQVISEMPEDLRVKAEEKVEVKTNNKVVEVKAKDVAKDKKKTENYIVGCGSGAFGNDSCMHLVY